MLTILLVIIVVLLLTGGGLGYRRRAGCRTENAGITWQEVSAQLRNTKLGALLGRDHFASRCAPPSPTASGRFGAAYHQKS
jgi:hypothetical protein